MPHLATLMKLCMNKRAESVVECVMGASITQWAEIVKSANPTFTMIRNMTSVTLMHANVSPFLEA